MKTTTRLIKAERAANIGSEKADMVKVTFSNGKTNDLFITDAMLFAMGMIDYETLEGEPAGVKDPYIIEVDFIDKTLLEHKTSHLLMQQINYTKEIREHETVRQQN